MRTLDRLLAWQSASLTPEIVQVLLQEAVLLERQSTTLSLLKLKLAKQINLDMAAVARNCVAWGFTEALLVCAEHSVIAALDTEQRSIWFFVTDLTSHRALDMISQ